MSEKQIGYLLGAGASCNALPLVSNMLDRLSEAIDFIKKSGKNDTNEIIKDFEWLRDEAKNHSSVDTFAKKLYIQNRKDDLLKLKIVLMTFFLMEQKLDYVSDRTNYIDMRYDTFFASIIGDKSDPKKLPDNIKIFSWNYDSQIEMSAHNFFPDLDDEHLLLKLQSYPITQEYENKIDTSKFSVIKLNGTAGAFKDKEGLGKIPDLFENISKTTQQDDSFLLIIKLYENFKQNGNSNIDKVRPFLHFAWEDDKQKLFFISQAVNIMKSIDILIIIGYSFPFFNREIDKQLLSNNNIQKIYLQVPEQNHKAFTNRIRALTDNESLEIIPLNDIEQFFIPYEF